MTLFTKQFKKLFLKRPAENEFKNQNSNNKGKGESSGGRGRKGIKGPPPGPKCFECHGYGHLAHECINKLKKKTNYKANITWDDDNNSESSEEGKEEHTNFIAFGASLHSQTSDKPRNDVAQESSNDSENEDGCEFDDDYDLRESYDRLYCESAKINKVNLKLIGKCQAVNVELVKVKNQLDEQQELLISVTRERDKLRKEAVDYKAKIKALEELNNDYEVKDHLVTRADLAFMEHQSLNSQKKRYMRTNPKR
ncbi:hypothetical protein Vadar_015191 [Vaccinium darrowii]|uniref:Uncharacterized protein n=1 Tax=Vaccinium darrowii TaxID=229202 RepID=A0ACB7XAG6_9ERIC|nr:hypothetical protein Vadar_015191 [Vaccinium darrowii]